MFRPRLLLFAFLVIAAVTWLSAAGVFKRTLSTVATSRPQHHQLLNPFQKKLKQKAIEAKSFVATNGYNPVICFLVDMSLPSGQSRFFVYNMAKDSLYNSGLVTHGNCNQWWLSGRKFGNTVGCGCTSLGKYKVGHSYNGQFGLAYKLYGLDKTNNKAFERFVVLHSHSCVPETEVTDDICQSEGCPTVAPGFLQQLKPIIDASGKPVLLWIYE
jgi:hypothetical protein